MYCIDSDNGPLHNNKSKITPSQAPTISRQLAYTGITMGPAAQASAIPQPYQYVWAHEHLILQA